MFPNLLKIGDARIYTYGFFIAIGFLVGILLLRREARRIGIDPDKMLDLTFITIISSLIGSRLFFIFTDIRFFLDHPKEIFKIWNGGLVFYGGFIAAFAACLVYIAITRMPLWKTADIMAPPLAIGHFFGRLGCFAAGCCFGKKCDLPWAVVFNHPDALAPLYIPLHPTQLYSALGNFLLFVFLMRYRRYKTFDGQIFWLYILFYAVMRGILEIFRGDYRGFMIFNVISISQTISIVSAMVSMVMLCLLKRKEPPQRPAGE